MISTTVSLIVQPGDSFFPIVEAIDSARSSIDITIFRMDDPVIQKAMLEAVARGVRVRALIAASPRGWEKQNKKILRDLGRAGVETKRPLADSKKQRYHYKILVVDRELSLVLTFNPTRENLHYTRDYGVVVHDTAIASELRRLFDADWNDKPFEPEASLPLAISPYNSRAKIVEFLYSAKRSIHISDAKVRDAEILALLRAKAAKGVEVRILGKDEALKGKTGAIQYRQISRFKMHAKCVVVDAARAIIGSMNLRPSSLDRRREVGIFVDDPKAIVQLEHVFDLDWNARTSSLAGTKRGVTAALDELPVVTTASESERKPAAAESSFALLSRTDALTRIPLFDGENSIGRAAGNDIVVPHPSVSRSHAKIIINGSRQTLVDLESHNGTFLNGIQVSGPTPIRPGDIIALAQSDEFRFVEV